MLDRRSSLALGFAVASIVWGLATSARAGDTMCAPAIRTCTAEEIAAIPVRDISTLLTQIQVTPGGYSDFVIARKPPFPRWDPRTPTGPSPLHEMFSGEWAAAIGYDSLVPIWLEPCFRYPEWRTNSNFSIVEVPDFSTDLDADGIHEGSSLIRNPDLEIRIHYDFQIAPGGVAMGKGLADPGGTYESSDPFVFIQTYDIKNTTSRTLQNVSLYQFAHMHPANAEGAIVDVGWDGSAHAAGLYQNYRYDITGFATNSGLTDNTPTGSTFRDHVSFSSSVMPAAHGLGTYRGHLPGDGGLPSSGGLKPIQGEHCDIENRTLANETTLLQDEAAGSMRFDLGNLAPGATTSLSVMLSFQTRARGIPAASCLQIVNERTADPVIRLTRGPCPRGGTDDSGPWDVMYGSLYDLQLVPGCSPSFDCTALVSPVCIAQGYASNEITVTEDAHLTDALFYLVRPSGRFSSWGSGAPRAGELPIERFFFTPATAPDVDACDVIP